MRRPSPDLVRLVAVAVVVGAAVAALVLATTAVIILLDNSDQARQQRAVQLQALHLLIDCTTPPAERKPPVTHPPADDCYLRSQAQTGRVVGQIGDLSIVAAACGAAHPGDVPATRACVEEAMR